MNETVIVALISGGISIITALIGFFSGRRTKENEATKRAFENYSFALKNLREEFNLQINELREENRRLKEQIEILKKNAKKI